MGQLGELGQRLGQLVMPGAGPIRLVVVQPTPFCNINCSYCYLTRRNDRARMSMEVIDAVGQSILASPLAATDVSVVWHAGEPTMVPIAWYERAFSQLATVPGVRLNHSFQTNGVAVNSDWIDLWRRWNVRVGVSIDGPREINDRHRRTRGDRGSFDAAINGLRRLRESGYPFHVISVLTRSSLEQPDELMDFYLSEGITYVCFNVEEERGSIAPPVSRWGATRLLPMRLISDDL